MRAAQDSASGGRLSDRISIGVLARYVSRDTVDEVLAETGKKERRTRLLPAHVMVYFVIAMAVFHDGYEELIRTMVNGLQFLRGWSDSWSVPTTSAITQARDRLGEQPMKVLYERVAGPLAKPGSPGSWLRSWRLMAIDAVQVDVPDSPANLAEFGKYEGANASTIPADPRSRAGRMRNTRCRGIHTGHDL
jgi:hypothetical protein